MINTGYHVYPDEIEAVLREVAGVGQALVAGEPHPRWGEMLVAYVVPSAPAAAGPALEAAMRDHLGRRLARYKVPREFRIVSALPAG